MFNRTSLLAALVAVSLTACGVEYQDTPDLDSLSKELKKTAVDGGSGGGYGGGSGGGSGGGYGGGSGGCPPVYVECSDGRDPIDLDGDGCALECEDALDGGSAP